MIQTLWRLKGSSGFPGGDRGHCSRKAAIPRQRYVRKGHGLWVWFSVVCFCVCAELE